MSLNFTQTSTKLCTFRWKDHFETFCCFRWTKRLWTNFSLEPSNPFGHASSLKKETQSTVTTNILWNKSWLFLFVLICFYVRIPSRASSKFCKVSSLSIFPNLIQIHCIHILLHRSYCQSCCGYFPSPNSNILDLKLFDLSEIEAKNYNAFKSLNPLINSLVLHNPVSCTPSQLHIIFSSLLPSTGCQLEIHL